MIRNSLLEYLNYRVIKNSEITNAIKKLSYSELLTIFLTNNNDLSISEIDICNFITNIINKLLDKKIQLSIIKNVYDEFSIMFIALGLSQKTISQKNFEKMFIDLICNSSKFDIFYKELGKNTKRISGDRYIMEIFWLIPLFVNPKVLKDFDYNDFIEQMQTIANNVDGYIDGYKMFVLTKISDLDKESYKLFLKEGVVSSSESTSLSEVA